MTEQLLKGQTILPTTKRDIEEGNTWYKYDKKIREFTYYREYSTGYTFIIGRFLNKTILFDNFSSSPFVVSNKKLDEDNFTDSLDEICSNSLTSSSISYKLTKAKLFEELKKAEIHNIEEAVNLIEDLFEELVNLGEKEEPKVGEEFIFCI